MDINVLDVDLNKRTAKMVLPYVTFTCDNDKQKKVILDALSNVDDIVFEVDSKRVSVKMTYDFGKRIPDAIWELRDNSLIGVFRDDGLQTYWDNMCKEAVLEYVKKLMPSVVKALKRGSESLIEYFNGKSNE